MNADIPFKAEERRMVAIRMVRHPDDVRRRQARLVQNLITHNARRVDELIRAGALLPPDEPDTLELFERIDRHGILREYQYLIYPDAGPAPDPLEGYFEILAETPESELH